MRQNETSGEIPRSHRSTAGIPPTKWGWLPSKERMINSSNGGGHDIRE